MFMANHHFSTALILAGCLHATVKLYRCTHLQEQLARLGIAAEVQEWHDQPLAAEVTERFDLLILQRTVMSANLRRLIEAMQRRGKLVIFDTDDLVFEPAMSRWHRGVARLSPIDQELYQEGVALTLATLQASDLVLTASPFLAEVAQRRGKPAFVHRNAVGDEMQQVGDHWYAARQAAQAQRDLRWTQPKVILGYGSGTPTHDVDFAEAAPALLDLLARFPQVELWLFGPLELPASFESLQARIRRHGLYQWQRYLELASQIDIALAPLERGNLFCRAKSEIKFVEAGLLGIPTVATRIDPFEQAIESGVNGFLAASITDWIGALEQLILHPDLRQTIGAAARQTVETRYSATARTADLAATLEQIAALPRQATKPVSIEPAMSHASSEPSEPMSSHAVTQPSPLALPAPTEQLPLVLNWIVTEPFRGSGGHLGVFRMIKHLVDFGHECHVYIVPVETMHNYSAEQLQRFVDQQILPTGAHFHRWTGRVHNADATVATYWATVQHVLSLPNPGRRYYLVQDFEPYFYPMGSEYVRAELTYRQGFHCLTLGPWLAKLMREQYGAEADHFDFAVDTDIYWPQPYAKPNWPRVAFYARPSTARRAYEIGVEALALVKQQYPEVEILFFGANDVPTPNFPVNNLGVRNPYELVSLYSSCDVGLVISLTNPSFVPFEMMACKCAVVDVRSERVADLLIDRDNALLAEPTPESLAAAILELLWNKELRTEIVDRAYEQVRTRSWQASARQLERALLDHAPAPAERRLALRRQESDADSLLWQIHQLLDHQSANAQHQQELEALLQRTLAEKAQLAEQLRQLERTFQEQQTRWSRMMANVHTVQAETVGQAPLWVLDGRSASKVTVGREPIQQSFTATQSHLQGIDLLFAPDQALAEGALRIQLHEQAAPDHPLIDRVIPASLIQPSQPFTVEFPAQPYSSSRTYVISLAAAGEAGRFAHALWRTWSPTERGAQLQRGGQSLRGQLLYQLRYAVAEAEAPSASQLALATPQPLATAATQAAQRGWQSAGQMTRKVGQTWRTQGINGLVTEVLRYLTWQVDKRLKP